jgi:two-component system response regulator HydG
MSRILIIEDDVPFSKILQVFLNRKSFSTDIVHNINTAKIALQATDYDLTLIDYRLPDGTGLDLINWIRESLHILPAIIVMTSVKDIRVAVQVMRTGAYDYITKPINHEELILIVEETLTKRKQVSLHIEESRSSNHSEESLKRKFIKGSSPLSDKMYKTIDLVAPTELHVLIRGESGTGKEHLARIIHEKSKRANMPFIALDCGVQSNQLAASELFGHIKGAFTGAVTDKKGVLESANGGTIFLDELGNMSYEVQIKLLRALQEKSFYPIGSSKEIKFNVRIIAATNADLLEMTENGQFRLDLLHRINEISVEVPALSQRLSDLNEFIDFFISEANKELNKNIQGVDEDVIKLFLNYDWPGNIRELRNIIRRSVLLADKTFITKQVLPPELLRFSGSETASSTLLKDIKHESEKELIIQTLHQFKYNKTLAAKHLGIDRKTLYNKLSKFGLD